MGPAVQGPCIKSEGNGHCRDVRTEPSSGGWSSAALWPYLLSTAEEWGSSGPAGVLFAGDISRQLVRWLGHFSPKEFNNLDCFFILFPITAPGGSSLGMRL